MLDLGLRDQPCSGGPLGLVLRHLHALGRFPGLVLCGPHPELGLLRLRLRVQQASGGLAGLLLCCLEPWGELGDLFLRGLCTDLRLFRLGLSGPYRRGGLSRLLLQTFGELGDLLAMCVGVLTSRGLSSCAIRFASSSTVTTPLWIRLRSTEVSHRS